MSKFTHIDDWIDRPVDASSPEAYAKFLFWYWRYPAWAKFAFDQFMRQHKLFCAHEGKRYRVTGCSRLGDIWLTTDFARDMGYDKRVSVTDCSDWSPAPESKPAALNAPTAGGGSQETRGPNSRESPAAPAPTERPGEGE